jgi:FtsH-binding integral membrane protein
MSTQDKKSPTNSNETPQVIAVAAVVVVVFGAFGLTRLADSGKVSSDTIWFGISVLIAVFVALIALALRSQQNET